MDVLYGRVAGSKDHRVPLAVDVQGRLITAPLGGSTLQALGFVELTSTDLSSAVGFDVPEGATTALIQATGTQAVRWRDDENDPTPMMGMRLQPDAEPFWYTGDLNALRFIREQEGAVVVASFYT